MKPGRSVVSTAKLIALCTLASRVTGLIRDILLAQVFALGWVADAFAYAFQFPNLFRRLFGEGALAPVFIPAFTRTLHNEGRPAASALLSRTFALMTVALVGVVFLVELIVAAVWLLAPVEPSAVDARRLLLSLTALMLPFMVSICLLALFSAILNCVGSFVPAAIAPILLNLAMIVALAWLAPRVSPGDTESARAGQAYVVAGAVLVAGAAQLLIVWPVLRRHGVRPGWRFEPRDAGVQRLLRLLPPVALGQGVLAFGVFLDSQICILLTHKSGTPAAADWFGLRLRYPLDEGALAALSYAQRLYQFPLGVLAISLATAALPTFSRLAAVGDWAAWTGEVRRSVRIAIFEGIFAGTMMIVLAEPIVRLLFQRGNFTAADTHRTAYILAWYGLGLWAFCAQHMVMRAFYSLGDVRTPLRISVAVLPLNVAITLALVWRPALREAAFAIASATTAGLAVVVGLAMLQHNRAARLIDRESIWAIGRMLLAGGVAATVILALRLIWPGRGTAAAPGLLERSVETLGQLGLGGAVFLAAARFLDLSELEAVMPRILRSRRRQGEASAASSAARADLPGRPDEGGSEPNRKPL
jgi:putative peptidoglycan lipid II flippase